MKDPIRHVVVDTNILGDFLYPKSTRATKRVGRSQVLMSAVVNAKWPAIKLYTPAICIAESMGILDKYRFCTWGREVKQDPTLKLSAADYRTARKLLTDAVGQRTIEQLEHEPTHVLLAGLISPVNSHFQIRRNKHRIKPPMGAADCVIAGMAIHLVSRMGRESVLLVTGDQRMADVVRKAEKVKDTTAEKLGLTSLAKSAGLTWNAKLYPKVLNLQRATESELKAAFGGWPLPGSSVVEKSRAELEETERKMLRQAWLEVATEYGITNADNLPYSRELEDIKVRFAIKSSVYLPNDDIFRFLLQQRKAKKLPYPQN